jgi:hypothetical protein
MKAVPQSYIDWNARLLDYCLEESGRRSTNFELITQQMLVDQVEDDANEQFVDSVKTTYAILKRRYPDPLEALASSTDPDMRPMCGALLGLSVMAAEEMEGLEYYVRLANLLDQDLVAGIPDSFDTGSFEACWFTLSHWANRSGSYFRQPETGKRFIKWPQSQALLRRMDVMKLPDCFSSAKLSPLRTYSQSQIGELLDIWCKDFTPQGKAACADKLRKTGVVRQILHTLSVWDGATNRSHLTTGSLVKCSNAWIEVKFQSGQPQLFFRAFRKVGYPEVIKGFPNWIATEENIYEPGLANNDLLTRLQTGFESGQEHRVRYKGNTVFVLRKSDYGGFTSEGNGNIPMGQTCIIIVKAEHKVRIEQYLLRICSEPFDCKTMTQTAGWVLFSGVKATRREPPPMGFEQLSVSSVDVSLSFTGGLRTGTPNVWLACVPPTTLEVSATTLPSSFEINGNTYALVDGICHLGALLSKPGHYEFRVGIRSRKITIIAARATLGAFEDAADSSEIPFIMEQAKELVPKFPTGKWVAIGSKIGEICHDLDSCMFDIQWLAGTDDDGVSGVVSFVNHPSTPTNEFQFWNQQSRNWAQVITSMADNPIGSINQVDDKQSIIDSWHCYLAAARKYEQQRNNVFIKRSESRYA